MINYSGKTIFIGLDVHKKTYSFTALCDGTIVKKATLEANYTVLLKFITKYFKNAAKINTYEAGFSGFGLHRFLLENNINNIVVHAASIEISSRDRVKTDKRDSLKIATQLAAGRLKCIYIPSKEQEAKRSITRMRDTLVSDRKRIICRIKHFLHQHSLPSLWNGEKKLTKRWVKEAFNYKFDFYELTYVFQLYLIQWQELTAKIIEISKEIDLQNANDPKTTVFLSVPGVGPITTRILANELGDMLQFTNEKHLFSYTGLTPCEYSSGEHTRQGHISRCGKPIIRKILVQAAWRAIKKDKSLENIYNRIAYSGGGKKKAIVGVARRLIGRIRTCLHTGELYNKKAA